MHHAAPQMRYSYAILPNPVLIAPLAKLVDYGSVLLHTMRTVSKPRVAVVFAKQTYSARITSGTTPHHEALFGKGLQGQQL